MTLREEKILGGLLGAAVGDSMGAATETRTTDLIVKRFGSYVTDLLTPPDDVYAHGFAAGSVTDDFSVSYFSAEEFLKDGGINRDAAIRGVLRWADHPLYSQCMGPTTRASVNTLRGIPNPPSKQDRLLCVNNRASNGAPMKVGCVGLFDACDVDKAIDDAIVMCMVTHDNTIALAGASGIAAATAKAMEERVSYIEVLQAGIYGIHEGFKRSEKVARPVAGADIERRTQLAIEIGLKYQDDFDKAMREIADIIGGGLPAAEAVPAAFGYIAATKGDCMDTIIMAVNAGDDTDTVACMAGYIVGALNSASRIPQRFLEKIEKVNGFDLQGMASGINALLERRK